jgi:hypothetical protein
MVVVMASATRSADALINYALDDKPNQKGERYVMASGVGGLLVSVAKPQMRDVRKRWGKDRRGAYVQAYHVIQSFGTDELIPNDPDSWMTAQRLGRALAEDRFPGRQVLVVTQRDGKTGCLHNHVVVNSIETKTGKSLNSSIVMHSRLVEAHERILEAEGFEQRADLRQAFSDAQDRHERGEPSGLRRAGSSVESETREYIRYVQWEYESEFLDENGLPRDPEPFSVDVLKYRVEQAINDPTSVDWESFVEAGARHGVRIEQRGAKGRGISYGMMRAQPDGTRAEPSSSDRRRSTTLGAEYEMDAVEQALTRHLDARTALQTPPAPSGIRLPAPPSTSPRKSIEEQLREAMEQIDKQFALQAPIVEAHVHLETAVPVPPAALETPEMGHRTARMMPDEAKSRAPATDATRDAPSEKAAPPSTEASQPGTASEAATPPSIEEETRTISQRSRRLGLPLLTREEFAAQTEMTPKQRRLRLEHPELYEDSADGSVTDRQGREFGN